MTSKSLLERVRELVGSGAKLDERVDTLNLHGALPTVEAQLAWLSFAKDVPRPFTSIQVYDREIGDDLGDGDGFEPSRELLITIGKPRIPGVTAFVFQASIGPYLRGSSIEGLLLVEELKEAEEFSARGLDVRHWDLDAEIPERLPTGEKVDPTKNVRDFVPMREVPNDLRPWILRAAPIRASSTFIMWEATAARRLLASLVSRAFEEDGNVILQASGPPVLTVRADSGSLADARSPLDQSASWVYLSGSDIEVRHLLFATELARANRTGQAFADTVDYALQSAKAAYEAHVQSASRETLKVLTDLRKTVVEDVQKVLQKTQDLTSTLWRDLAVSAAPLALKALGDAEKAAGTTISGALCIGAAIFIAISFTLQWRTNEAYFVSQKSSRESWTKSLYSYISAEERANIADGPITSAIKNYRQTRNVLVVVYAVLFLVLCFAAWQSLTGDGVVKASGTVGHIGSNHRRDISC